MTHLASYLRETKTPQVKLAKAIGISRAFMSEIVGGKKKPSRKVANQIEVATGGKVTTACWDQDQQQGAA